MAERALSEHLHSLVLLHGARRNQLQRGTSCLARLFYLGRGVERARGGRGSPMRWRSVFRGSGAYPGWMARSDVLERSLGDTHGRARYGCVVPSRPKQRVDFLCQKIGKKKRYIATQETRVQIAQTCYPCVTRAGGKKIEPDNNLLRHTSDPDGERGSARHEARGALFPLRPRGGGGGSTCEGGNSP